VKLFNFDNKHEWVNGELDLGIITESEKALLQKVIDFLEIEGITNRYKTLMLAEKYSIDFVEDDDFPVVVFHADESIPCNTLTGKATGQI
jgi:hypothetical protein